MIIKGDCLEVLKTYPDNHFTSVITDPPYGLHFMGKTWDEFSSDKIKKSTELVYKYDYIDGVPVKRKKPELVTRDSGARIAGTYDDARNDDFQEFIFQIGKELLRVAKPGATILMFGSPRRYHRQVCGLEDAGWVIKDSLMWLFGSGFPKATDISKQVEKVDYYKSSEWNGYKSHALKPAYEPIIMAMKPNDGTYANNALKWGVSGINIDKGRINGKPRTTHSNGNFTGSQTDKVAYSKYGEGHKNDIPQGRFPSNIILDEEAGAMLDQQSGVSKSFKAKRGLLADIRSNKYNSSNSKIENSDSIRGYNDKGGAPRFFYCAKASKSERNKGCEGLEKKAGGSNVKGYTKDVAKGVDRNKLTTNHHPTVKPLALMKYLINLIMPPTEGLILDPFAGSGTTILAAKQLGYEAIGIEREEGYCEIAERRITDA